MKGSSFKGMAEQGTIVYFMLLQKDHSVKLL